jgi:hypothetical protein
MRRYLIIYLLTHRFRHAGEGSNIYHHKRWHQRCREAVMNLQRSGFDTSTRGFMGEVVVVLCDTNRCTFLTYGDSEL